MQYTPAQRTRFAQTVVDCRPGMYRIALGMLRSPADAEDAVSAAIVTAYARLHALRNESALPAYLMKCTVNACRAALRKRKRELPTQNMAIYESSAPEGDNVWEYLHALPEKYRLTDDGLWFEYLDENGDIIGSGALGGGSIGPINESTLRNRQTDSLAAMDALPDTVTLRAYNCWTKERYETHAFSFGAK